MILYDVSERQKMFQAEGRACMYKEHVHQNVGRSIKTAQARDL